ncbi:MAG TPA: hypothetical protein ENJ18_08960 [Nannocystis exedens]|nr:hypothetical protein [Nannocystis exedens]
MAIEYSLLLSHTGPIDPRHGQWVEAVTVPVVDPARSWYQDDYGILPAQAVHLRLNKDDLRSSQAEMIAIVHTILQSVAGDAVLLYNGELAVLRRKGGQVVVSTRGPLASGDWMPQLWDAVAKQDLGGVP